jgi:2-oxoisovalerate ferredoxin oxidoreductase alpha subunit
MVTKLAKGNSAVIIGALYAGCNAYFGYPITPASEILHEAAKLFPAAGRQFVQAESEEAAINMVYGAAAAGRRVLTASSGPGVSLKQEGISYLAGAELPAVIVDVQRAGPGLGNIGPEQADYNQVVKGGGHGNYKCIVLAPNCAQEMCDFTMLAFDLAEKYRGPVYVLADGVLGQVIEPLTYPETARTPRVPEWAVAGDAATRKNLVTSIFLDFDALQAHNERLQKKYALIAGAEQRSEKYRADDAETLLVAYGACSRVARTVVDSSRAQGKKIGLFRPQTLFPFPQDELRALAAGVKKIVVAEMSNGQLRDDVKLAIDCAKPVALANIMGGNLITPEIIAAAI